MDRLEMITMMKVSIKRKILSIETILRAYTHARTHANEGHPLAGGYT